MSLLPYQSWLDLVDDIQEVFIHVPLRTSAMEPQSSLLNPCIDLKLLTPHDEKP
jgi:hypothetical protein